MTTRVSKTFSISSIDDFKSKLSTWSQQYQQIVWLDSNNAHNKNSNPVTSEFDALLAVDAASGIKTDYKNAFEKLQQYQKETNDFIFGYLGYDLKNDVEKLTSSNHDGLEFDDLYFFQPKKIIRIKGSKVVFEYLPTVAKHIDDDFKNIQKSVIKKVEKSTSDIKIKLRIHKDEYFEKINKVLEHIHRGDIYEVSYCQEFYAENSIINPLEVYQNLNKISSPPFATFLKIDDKYLLSASPERFLKRKGNTIVSQPIKGTIKRGKNKNEDLELTHQLQNDQKERAENIMIVDLVRNDLSKMAVKGSVHVSELCEVYTFKQVHQLISTVVSEVNSEMNSVEIVKNLFPMGSMTGAPKVSAMKIIEALEETKRGLYSGAVGYFTPSGDFDFNVVIRSILYNKTNQYISYSVGGAITAKSIPEREYEECLLKAKAMREVLLNS